MAQMKEEEVVETLEREQGYSDLFRFLLRDHAFDEDFLLSTIYAYIAKHRKEIPRGKSKA